MKSFKNFLSEQDAAQLGRVVIVKDYDKQIPASKLDRKDFEQFVMQTGKYATKNQKGERVYNKEEPEEDEFEKAEREEQEFQQKLRDQPKIA